ncbi:hypothetical protein GYMLUDRAFT_73216 [Collybiopsis luxurians FD-317 M1]|uniref:Kinetochore protein Sos7 coiled-coil domain-containing protein n=1 Tax=Collybiopsis luxurians FD-317 M1 TaxID=944289 RepID=A0A0D0BDC7_9AGAR|nr:hypothetical protein GYMLUDRAFT_73216 [Collybiopsis luxurians FD-317 M1]
MDQEQYLAAAQSLQSLFDSTNSELGIVQSVADLNSHKFENDDDVSDAEDLENKDPAMVAANVSFQMSYLRKLKYQYLEQNAKHKYIKSIVSDIDDAPIVTDNENKQLERANTEQKEKLKVAKASLAELHSDIRILAPMVEEDYVRVKQATAKATDLAQKIIDARLALSRLRQSHPHPRITVQAADKKLEEQVEEMQALTDEKQVVEEKVNEIKRKLKSETLEVEGLKVQRNEIEKSVKMSESVEDDRRFVPLYDWVTNSLQLHRSLQGLEDFEAASENELRLRYRVEDIHGRIRPVSITLLFVPNSRQLATVNVQGLEQSEINITDIIDTHVEMNNVRGVVATILAHVREGL